MVRLTSHETLSGDTVGRRLAEMTLKPWQICTEPLPCGAGMSGLAIRDSAESLPEHAVSLPCRAAMSVSVAHDSAESSLGMTDSAAAVRADGSARSRGIVAGVAVYAL
jgi:hypothetical protein